MHDGGYLCEVTVLKGLQGGSRLVLSLASHFVSQRRTVCPPCPLYGILEVLQLVPQLVVAVSSTTTEENSSTDRDDMLLLIPISAQLTERALLEAPIVASNTYRSAEKPCFWPIFDRSAKY